MTEIAETSRIEAIDSEIFRAIRGRKTPSLIGYEMKEIYLAAPGLSGSEVGELDLRLRADGFLSPTDANKSLVGLAPLACLEEDAETVRSLRNHFLKHFNLIGAGLVYLEELKLGR